MAETPIFVATPFPSVSLDNGSETYFLLPFSTVSTIDGGGINALDVGSSSDSAVQNVFIDTQAMAALPIDSVHLISTSHPLASNAVFSVQNLQVSDHSVDSSAVRSVDAASEDCLYSPNGLLDSNRSDDGAQYEESTSGDIGETSSVNLACETCGYRAENNAFLEEHRQQWNDSRHYRCLICDSVFDQIEKLTAHEKQCRISKQYRCECGEMFNREINYTVHMATHHNSGKELRCPLCQDTFRRLASFRCHMKLHTVDDVVTCILCQEDFASNGELRHHMRTTHTATKQAAPVNICKQCGAVFKRPLELAEHMITHKKIKETLRTSYRRKRSSKAKTSVGKYSCAVCSKTFDKKSTYDRHQLIHTGERPFICQVCNKAFNQKGALMFHEARHLPQKPHKCQLCGAGFSQRGNLRTHVKRVHPATVADSDAMMECPMCSCWFKSTHSLQVHLARRHNEQLSAIGDAVVGTDGIRDPGESPAAPPLFLVQPMPSRPTTSSGRVRLVRSTIFQADKSSVPKTSLPVSSPEENSSIRRVETAAGQTAWQCGECNKVFAKRCDVQRHFRTHTGDRPFACESCPQRFALRATLDKHVRSQHLHLKSARCHICWKELSNSFTLSKHLRIHARETVSCEKCSKKFRTTSDLRRHAAKAHSGQEAVSSDDAAARHENLLQPLMETEMGVVEMVEKGSAADARTMPLIDESGKLERPHSCSYCPMRFKKRSHLEEHTRSHQNSRPYMCRFGNCRRQFFTASALRDHALIHSGVRREICGVCKKAFRTKRCLTRHMIVHSDPTIRPFICPYCGKRFKRGVLCRQHIKTVHKSDPRSVVAESAQGANGNDGHPAAVESTWPIPTAEHDYGHGRDAPAPPCETWNAIHQPNGTYAQEMPPAAAPQPEEQHFRGPAPDVTYVQTEQQFLAETPMANNTFVPCWDSPGHHLTPTSMDCSNTLPPVPGSVLQTPVVASDPAMMSYPILHSTPVISCELCSATFRDEAQLATHTSAVHGHQDGNFDMGMAQAVSQPIYESPTIIERPIQSSITSDSRQQWSGPKFSCPECGHIFQKAGQLSRHVFDVHPTSTASTTTSTWNTPARSATTQMASLSQESAFMAEPIASQHPSTSAQGGYGATMQEEHHQAVLNMTGQLPVWQINGGEHVWNSVAPTTLCNQEPPVQVNPDGKNRCCPCCGKAFKKPSDLVRHIRTHTDERPYVCECGRGFRTKTALASHKQTHETNRPIMHRCQVCNKICASRGALKSHLRRHTNEKLLRCPHCVEECRSATLLKQHLLVCHGVDSEEATSLAYQQPQNAQVLGSGEPSAFTQVVPTRASIVQPQLADNDRLALFLLYNANNELQVNVQRVTNDCNSTQNPSVIVGVGFLRELAAQRLTMSIPVRCDGSANETTLTVDPAMLLEQATQVNQVASAESAASLPSTSRIPEPPTPSAYLTTFPSADGEQDLGTAVASTREKASETSFIVECKICDLKFSNVHESRAHFQSPDHETAVCIQRDTRNPSHLCDICGKLFVTRIRLMRHMRSHTGERPFECTVCGECFTQSNSLKKHYMAKHTDVRPFVCPCCDRRFALKYNMETHVRRVHGQTNANENVVAVEAENSRFRTYLLSL